jgi:hypothetical protein
MTGYKLMIWLGLGPALLVTGLASAQQSLGTWTPADSAGHQIVHPGPAATPQFRTRTRQAKPRLGPLDLAVNWRTRAEVWDWFAGATGDGSYAFWHSLLRAGIGHTGRSIDWFVEGSQVAILGLPDNAAVAPPEGQLGLGGTYYAANNNHTNNTGAFLKQAYVNLKRLGPVDVKLGRFEYFDGTEVKPSDATLASVVQSGIAHRLISNFGFAAAQRSFDGGQVSWSSEPYNVTLLAARPTAGIFQVDGMDELHIEIYSGAFTQSFATDIGAGQLRLLAMGYVDDRTQVLKTDNRQQAARTLDHDKIQLATFGGSYAQVFTTAAAGNFDVVFWGVLQAGSWGSLRHRASAFVGEFGWQPPRPALRPWVSIGLSYGSGDGNPNDDSHGTFFQVLTTPRQYARFPFYNMMNTLDLYGTLSLRPGAKASMRSELHSLRLANAADLWYLGGGAFQPATFGYVGRPSGGYRGLATVWDVSGAYALTPNVAVNLYYGRAWGKDVIASIYPRNGNAQFLFLETNVHF